MVVSTTMIQVIQLRRLFCVNGFFYFKFSPVLPESLSHCSGDRNIVDLRYITRLHNVIWLINPSFKILTFVYEPSRKTLGLLKALRSISRAADSHLCHTLFQGVQGTQYNLPTSGRPVGGVDMESKFFQELDILSPIRKGVPPEVIFIFIMHTLVIPTLSLREMAQAYRPLCPGLTNIICQEFLSVVFSNAAKILGSNDYPFAVDGTIYVTLIAFVLSGHVQLRTAIGPSLFSKAEELWAAIGGPRLDFPKFAKQYPLESKEFFASIQCDQPEPAHLLEFSNPLFDEEFSSLHVSSDEALDADSPKSNMHFEPGVILSDNCHWHSQTSLLPSHQGGTKPKPEAAYARSRRLRSNQRFMAIFQAQASSLTGAFGTSLQQIVIPPVGSQTATKGKQLVRQKVCAQSTSRDIYILCIWNRPSFLLPQISRKSYPRRRSCSSK